RPGPRIKMNHMNPGKTSCPRESTSPLVTPSGALFATCEDWRSKISPKCYLCRSVLPKRIDPHFSVVIDRSGGKRLHVFIRVTRSIAFTLGGSSSQTELRCSVGVTSSPTFATAHVSRNFQGLALWRLETRR